LEKGAVVYAVGPTGAYRQKKAIDRPTIVVVESAIAVIRILFVN